jgi:penicillin-binding protein 1A
MSDPSRPDPSNPVARSTGGDGISADDLTAVHGAGPAAPAPSDRRRNGGGNGNGNGHGPRLVALDGGGDDPAAPPPRPKLKLLRLIAILAFLGVLATLSAIFGMMMAVASDLPAIDVLDVAPRSSVIADRDGRPLGVLTGNENRILDRSNEIAPVMKHAIVAIEDRRFYTNSGVDLRGIARALWQDVVAHKAVQGGSTIAQQLVKNRLEAQNDRTIFQKAREAAMAFHMTRKWDKERILRNYLNTIYFGNGAYGIESAARTYFGRDFGVGTDAAECGPAPGEKRCASLLDPAQSALIAATVANPSAYDPIAHPQAARERRNLVLQRMRDQGFLTGPEFTAAVQEPVPTSKDVQPPQVSTEYPYFTTWVRQQVVDQVGAGKAFEGGLKVETTIDSGLQDAAQAAVTQWLGPDAGSAGKPAAALVALDNRTSQVLAMVGGPPDGYNERPFNLATQGQRQPGSSFKPFILARALEEGYTPESTFESRRKEFCVVQKHDRCIEQFVVNNYDDAYSGVTNLANATAFSDNSVFAELGLKVGTRSIARLARRMGIRTPVSKNYAMTLGGLKQGVTPLDMAHAYESFASGGDLVYGSLSPGAEAFKRRHSTGTVPGPVGIRRILEPKGDGRFRTSRLLDGDKADNDTRTKRVLPQDTARSAQEILQGVVRIGSGERASLGPDIMVAGKTGTTENYGDAWFVGWTPRYTVAVWVGYPDSVKPMEPPNFSFNGEPVAGGTYPAAIWGTFMRQAMDRYERDHPGDTSKLAPQTAATPGAATAPSTSTGTPVTAEGGAPPPAATAAPSTPAPQQPAPSQQTPATPAAPETAPTDPAPAPPSPAGGGGGGGDGGGTSAPSGGEPAPGDG